VAKIVMNDLQQDTKISAAEMKKVFGGAGVVGGNAIGAVNIPAMTQVTVSKNMGGDGEYDCCACSNTLGTDDFGSTESKLSALTNVANVANVSNVANVANVAGKMTGLDANITASLSSKL